MFARVVSWEGGEAEAMRKAAEQIKAEGDAGPPEGVPAVGFQLLIDADNGRAQAIVLFETEEKLRQGDETLNSMSPPGDGLGRRASVDVYEVGVDFRL